MSGTSMTRTPAVPSQRTLSEGGDNTCAVCHDPILMFAIGPCDHPICHRCSTRMRVLCEKNDCPICRGPTPQVAFVYEKKLFKDINLRNCIPNRKYKVFFEDEEVEDSYLDLLEFRCRMCKNRRPDKTFALLQTHMRREHELFACDLCVEHLEIFPYERKFYNRKNLAMHRRIGDADDKSYKGHPLCEFCDRRYHDKDELMKHLRKDHYFCHFCDQQGSNAYYDQYPDLMNHFSETHFLCSEGECGNPTTQFTHAFISDIDLKAHKAAVHTKNFTKAQAREARTLELDFQLPPRRQGRPGTDNQADGRSGQGSRGGERHQRRRNYNHGDADLERALEASRDLASQSTESRPPVAERVPDPVHDFPSLNGAAATTNSTPSSVPAQNSPEEDFPSLGSLRSNGASSSKQSAQSTKAYSSVMNPPSQPKQAPIAVRNESRPVVLGNVSSFSRGGLPSKPVVNKNEDEYPSLVGPAKRQPEGQGSWLAKGNGTMTSSLAATKSKTLAISKVPSRPVSAAKPISFKKTISDENEFPSLGGGQNRKNPNTSSNLYSDSWTTAQNGPSRKPSQTPRSQRVDDEDFELPTGYYTSLRDPTESSNISVIEQVDEVPKVSQKPAPNNSSAKDFPGLPMREKKQRPPDVANDSKKTKNSKKAKNKPPVEDKDMANASLSDIASVLMGPKGSKSNKSTNKASAPKKPTDWFDSPPEEYTKKMTPQQHQLEHQENQSQKQSTDVLENGFRNCKIEDSFPSLATSASVQKPPGFHDVPTAQKTSSLKEANSPPPPPGFNKASAITDLQTISSSLTTQSSGPPPGFTIPNAAYIEPPEFKSRNGRLIVDIREALETVEEGFSNFRALSGAFRQGMMEASDYYESIITLMGKIEFERVFPELLVLLPDVSKQKQLWEICQVGGLSGGKMKKGSVKDSKLEQCRTCGQVNLASDMKHHRLQHSGVEDPDDFPSLNGSQDGLQKGKSSATANSSWIKAK